MIYVFDDGGRAETGFRGITGDCVVRAIAIAADRSYADVYDELYGRAASDPKVVAQIRARGPRARSASPRNGVYPSVYKPYLDELGFVWVPTMRFGAGCEVHLADGEIPDEGRLVVRLSRHLCAVVDGAIHDTSDPSRDGTRCVYGYWRAP